MGCKQVKIRVANPTDVIQPSDAGVHEDRFPFGELRSDRITKISKTHMLLDQPKYERVNRVYEVNVPLKVVPKDIDLTPIDNHAFTPAICQQRQDAIDNMSYRRTIDRWQATSIEQLVQSIKEISIKKNEIDQAWIIFYWICKNISYDTEAYFSNNISAHSSKDIFLSRTAVCGGYATLYADLCSQTGLQCREVSGYAKGYSFNPRQTSFEKTNHAWNILTLKNGHSYCIESTWGAGSVDGSTRQHKAKLVPFYFLCRPEHMIYNHLPENPQWQLLAHPLMMKQYLMLPLTYARFFELKLSIVSPVYKNKVTLKTGETYGEVLIATPTNDVELSGSLRNESDTEIEGGHFVYFDHDQNVWRCHFAPQKPGKHSILIFGREKDDANMTSSCCIKFIFDIDHLPAPSTSYPHIWSHFFDYDLEIVKPTRSRYVDWPSAKDIPYCEILVRSPDGVRLSAAIKNRSSSKNISNGSLVNFDIQSMLWQCLFAPPTTVVPYKLTLFAQRFNENESHCVAQFDLQELHRKIPRNCTHFPSTYGLFNEAKCHLFEPLNGVLKRGSIVRFHCRIPGVCEVKITVDEQCLEDDSSYLNENDIFKREIQVGQREVAVWVKRDKRKSSYEGLLKYSVK